jgi:hypothetical protein
LNALNLAPLSGGKGCHADKNRIRIGCYLSTEFIVQKLSLATFLGLTDYLPSIGPKSPRVKSRNANKFAARRFL